jgi:hypothetical protein
MTKRVGMIAAAAYAATIAVGMGTAFGQGLYSRGYGMASDLDPPPYAAMPQELPDLPPPPRIYGPRYGDRSYDAPVIAPTLLPPAAVYGILRSSGYSPLGGPQQRGPVYTISVISPDGDDGRLVIDARSGRILRFLPAYRMGDRMSEEITVSYGPAGALPPLGSLQSPPRPPVAVPRVASRTPGVPLPKPMPARAVATPSQPVAADKPAKSKPADAQASIQPPAEPAAVPAMPTAVIEATPAIPATPSPQDMPPVQTLE